MKEYRNLWNRWKGRRSILYPTVCPFCNRLVKEGMCGECREKVVYVQEPFCRKCGKPVRAAEQEYCFDCDKTSHFFEEGRSIFVHKSPVAEAIYAMKYQNRRVYAQFFGKLLAEQHGEFLRKKKIDLIVPVPLHRSRKRVRGYNQAQLLAEELALWTGIPVDAKRLERRKKTRPQKNLNEKQRRLNIRGSFHFEGKLEGIKNILLVDDIYTTGSTLDEASRILLKSGAEKVYFLTISIGQGY